jgi:PAS domain-containing protein
MSFILVCSIAIRVIAFGWSVLLLFRIRDWRIIFLTGMIFLMALRQTLTLVKAPQIWPLSFSANIDELPGLVVSILAFLALIFLERMTREHSRRSAELESANQKLVTEIGERKRAEEALRESEAQLDEAIEAMSEGVTYFDAEDRLIRCNTKHRELFPSHAEFMVPGIKFEDLLRKQVENIDLPWAVGREEEWISERIEEHRNLGEPREQVLHRRTPKPRGTKRAGICQRPRDPAVGIQDKIRRRRKYPRRHYRAEGDGKGVTRQP